MKGYSPCIYNLICWEMGVIEYHRSIRNFCLNYYDMKILSKEEIIFCGQMDNINIMFNKLKYYTSSFSKEFKDDAIKLMIEINNGIYDEEIDCKENNNQNEKNEEEKKIDINIIKGAQKVRLI